MRGLPGSLAIFLHQGQGSKDRVSLCSSDRPRTHYVDQGGLESRDPEYSHPKSEKTIKSITVLIKFKTYYKYIDKSLWAPKGDHSILFLNKVIA